MVTLYSLYVVLLFVTAIVGIALAAYAWQRRGTPGAVAFVGVMLGVALFSFSLAMLAFTDSPEAADFWGRRVRFFANAMIPGLLLIFAIQYTGRGKWLSLPRLALLFTISLITLILTWGGEAHYLFLDLSTSEVGPFTFVGRTTATGPWSAVHLIYSYVAIFLSLILLLRQVFRTRFPYRGQATWLFVGGLVPFLANVPDSFMAAGPKPSFTPVGFAALGLIVAWALFRYRLFDIVPVARDLIIDSMEDAVLVLDEQHRLVDVNPAAQKLIGRTASELIGQPIAAVLPAWSDLGEHQDHAMHAEIVVSEGGESRHFAVREQPICDHGEHLVGCLVILRDISERKQAQELAVSRERERLARDLHDSVTQTLYSVALTAEALPRVWEKHPDEALEALNNLHFLARGALGEMRTLLFELQPAMLLEKGPEELMRQLAHATMGRTQTRVEVSVHGEHTMPDEVHVAFYRIAQEALNNVAKHAEASRVIVDLDLGPGQVVLHIEDDGCGFDSETVPRLSFGVRNMADRAKEIDATFSLQSKAGEGTQIQVVWQEHQLERPAGV